MFLGVKIVQGEGRTKQTGLFFMLCRDFRDDVHIVSTGVVGAKWMFATWLHGGLLIFVAEK